MNKILSLYLNFLRVVAALIVFLYHSGVVPTFCQGLVSRDLGLDDGRAGHLSVILFFVLSGFLISYSIHKPGMTLYTYITARIARMYSVVIPALALTAFTMLCLRYRMPAIYLSFQGGGLQPIRYIINLLFMQQLWVFCVVPSLLAPIWSLGYEFPYYILLACWYFGMNRRRRMIRIFGFCLFLGPKILMLLPSWLAGVVVQRALSSETRYKFGWLYLLFVLSSCIILCIMCRAGNLPYWSNRLGSYPLYGSANFLIDDLFSLVVALNIWTLAALNLSWAWLEHRLARAFVAAVNYGAGVSFSVYLYHVPLFYLIAMLHRGRFVGYVSEFFGLLGTLIAASVLANMTERKLPIWHKLVDTAFSWVIRYVWPRNVAGSR